SPVYAANRGPPGLGVSGSGPVGSGGPLAAASVRPLQQAQRNAAADPCRDAVLSGPPPAPAGAIRRRLDLADRVPCPASASAPPLAALRHAVDARRQPARPEKVRRRRTASRAGL